MGVHTPPSHKVDAPEGNSWICHCKVITSIGGSRGMPDACPPPKGPDSFISTQNFRNVTCLGSPCPLLRGPRPHLQWEILDLPLRRFHNYIERSRNRFSIFNLTKKNISVAHQNLQGKGRVHHLLSSLSHKFAITFHGENVMKCWNGLMFCLFQCEILKKQNKCLHFIGKQICNIRIDIWFRKVNPVSNEFGKTSFVLSMFCQVMSLINKPYNDISSSLLTSKQHLNSEHIFNNQEIKMWQIKL